MTRNILIVSEQADVSLTLKDAAAALDEQLAVTCMRNPYEALKWLSHFQPDLVVVDAELSYLNGPDLIRTFRCFLTHSDIPLLLVTATRDEAHLGQILADGVTDFLFKPLSVQVCRVRYRNLLTLGRQSKIIQKQAKWLEHGSKQRIFEACLREKDTLLRLAKAGEYRDSDTGQHINRIASYSSSIAKTLGMSEEFCDVVEAAAPMHDIGKIGIADSLLQKNGKFDSSEREIMQAHTVIGHDILKDSASKYLQVGAEIALAHHEKYDGSGYPYGLAGDEIPLTARIVAVADVYDALTSPRPYKRAWPVGDAISYLEQHKATHFDPQCVDAFLCQSSLVQSC